MPLTFQPKPGSVVMCDFRGFVAPEMVKIRPVVVLTKHRHNKHLLTVVPLSTTAPQVIEAHHHELSACPLPDSPNYTRVWAKCDMICTVALTRLDRYKYRGTSGRMYCVPTVSADDFDEIKKAVLAALSL